MQKFFFLKTTLLITVKDQNFFSKKLINYLNTQNIKINIFIADGSKKKQIKIFRKLKYNFKYFYFGPDKSLDDYFKKIYYSLNKIKTDFVIFCDQDDYINFKVLKQKELFLFKKNKYSCVQGKIYDFNYENNKIILLDEHNPNSITDHKNKFFRLLKNFKFRSYYCLHRTKILKNTFKKIINNQINDTRSFEFISGIMSVSKGQIGFLDECSLIRWRGNKYKKHPIKLIYNTRPKWFIDNFLLKNNVYNSIKNEIYLKNYLFIIIVLFFDLFPNQVKKMRDLFKKILTRIINEFKNKKKNTPLKKFNKPDDIFRFISDLKNKL